MDVARSVLRMGKKPLVIYRRTENEMPAIQDEIAEAKEEGIEFMFLSAPQRIIIRNNKITALECIRMKLGPADKSGRRTTIPVRGSNFRIAIDTVVPAIGEEVDISLIPYRLRNEYDRIAVADDGISTAQQGVFAGGDAVTGARTVVEALSAGKKAAVLINQYLKKTRNKPQAEDKPVAFEELNINYFDHQPRVQPSKVHLAERIKGFNEVYHRLSDRQVCWESLRCFSCGVCNKCDNCFVFCPDVSVIRRRGLPYEYDYDFCKGCGVCAVECPRCAITMVEEKK